VAELKTSHAKDLLSEIAALNPDGAAPRPLIAAVVAKPSMEPAPPDRWSATMARAEEPTAIPVLEAPSAPAVPLMDGVGRPLHTVERVAKLHLEAVAPRKKAR